MKKKIFYILLVLGPVRLCWKSLSATNTCAYNTALLITNVKKIKNSSPPAPLDEYATGGKMQVP
jgi:hypothetical protein